MQNAPTRRRADETAADQPQHLGRDDGRHRRGRARRGRAGTQIEAVQPSFGPASIEGHYDDVFGAAGVAEQVRLAVRPEAVTAPTRW
jgi:hypothetical protein